MAEPTRFRINTVTCPFCAGGGSVEARTIEEQAVEAGMPVIARTITCPDCHGAGTVRSTVAVYSVTVDANLPPSDAPPRTSHGGKVYVPR
jgi:DnaJ-class molecular chaperone